MRITDSTLAFVTSRTYSASLEAARSVTAWQGADRVQTTEAVKVSLSEREASATLAQVGDGTYRAFRGQGERVDAGHGDEHDRGRAGGSGGLGRGAGLAQLQASLASLRQAAAHGSPVASAAPASSAASAGTETTDATLSANDQAWLLLLGMTGDTEAASRLAERLAAFARRMNPDSNVASTLAAVAREHPSAAGKAPATAQGASLAAGQTSAAPAAARTPAPAAGQTPAPAAAPATADLGWGYREDVAVRVAEREQTSFAAAAAVTTADGREILVNAGFTLAREQVTTETTSLRLGDAARDPLVLALAGGAPTLGTGTSAVDVDNDGAAEQVASLAAGSAYLVRDLNGNGTIDDGSEMFGPATNNGFAELAALDSDGNGWIDEGDGAFAQLGVWSGVAGSAIRTLAEAGVGAMATASAVTPFTYASGGGTLSASSIFLYENGGVGISGDLNLIA